MMKGDVAERRTVTAERVEVPLAQPAEFAELDAQFVSRVGRAHELRLVDMKALQKCAQMRQRRLADAHDADFRRLDQADGTRVRRHVRKGGRRHPACGAAAHHHYPNAFVNHSHQGTIL